VVDVSRLELVGLCGGGGFAHAQLLNERGEKLSELAQKTAEMEDNSSEFYANAKKLADKYKNKKWYEF
jgi:hypothetical protein